MDNQVNGVETVQEEYHDYGVTELVKDSDRHYNFFDMFSTWAGANCQPSTWWIGGCIAASGFAAVLKINLLTVPIMFIIVALIGYIGFKYPTTSMGFARTMFGISGSRILALLHAISCLGWAGIDGYLGGCSLSYLFNVLFGWPCAGMEGSKPVVALGIFICSGLTFLLVTLKGSQGIKWLNKVSTVLIILLSVWIAIAVFKNYSISDIMAWRAPAEYAITFGVGTDKITAFAFGWVICTIEFTRYTKTKIAATGGPMLGCWIGLSLFAIIGAMGVIASAMMTGVFNENAGDPSGVAATLGLGLPAFIVILLSVVTTAVVTYFVGACSALNFVDDKIAPKKMHRGFSGLCFVFAFLPLVFDSFMDFSYTFLDVLGLLWPGFAAILLVDFYIIRKKKYRMDQLTNKHGPYMYTKGYNLYAWSAYVVGVICYLVFLKVPILYNAVGALYPSFVVSGVLYFILAKVALKRQDYGDLLMK